MGISGNLETMELSELLQWVSNGKKTGTLLIDNGQVKKKIYFRGGRIISSASTDPREHLGHFLVSHGYINEEELSRAVSMQEKSRMLLGKILTTIGAISEEDLHRLLRLKAEESVYELFSWEQGEFRFIDGELPEQTMVPMDLDATSIVLEGVQRLDEWKRIREVIPSAQAVPVAVGDALADPGLTAAERQVLEQVDDDRTVEEIQIQTHSSEFLVSKILYEEVRKGRLKMIRPRHRAAAGSRAGAPSTLSGKGMGAQELVAQAKRHLAAREYEKALRHLRAARSLEPNVKAIQQALERAEEIIARHVEKTGVRRRAVPRLPHGLEELTQLDLTPQEGFILTRVDGAYDIRSIVKITPMPQIDALLVFWRLFEAGHIELA